MLISSDNLAFVILRNVAVLGAAALAYKGATTFLGKPSFNTSSLILVTLAIAATFYWTLISPDPKLRNLATSSALVPFYLLTAYHYFMEKGSLGERYIYRALASSFALAGLGLASRTIPMLGVSSSAAEVMNPGYAQPVALLCISILIFVNGFLCMLLISGRLKRKLARRAHYDTLTRLRNRFGFFDRAKDLRGECGVLVIDLDEFKALNDTYGHSAGDHVLRVFSATLKQHLRTTDICARAGGEEFWVALPGSTLQECIVVASRIKSSVADTIIQFGGMGLRLTVSIGVTNAYLETTADIELVIQEADRALLTAKQSGKNQVVSPLSMKPKPESDIERAYHD